jgi:hypothetical protein
MSKSILFTFLLLISSGFLFAQNQTSTETITANSEETITGTLEKRPWSKSLESYCAQGSDYYCLVETDTGKEWVLQALGGKNTNNKFVNKKVSIIGVVSTKTIETTSSNNPKEISQRPVSSDPVTGESREEAFTCTVFIVKKITRLK